MWDEECSFRNLRGRSGGHKVFLSHTGLSLTRFFVHPFLLVPSPLSASFTVLASRLGSPCQWFCPLPPLWCGVSLVYFMSCQWSLSGPPLPLASQTSPASLQGPVHHCVFFLHWPSCSSLALRFLLFQWTGPGVHLGPVLFDPWGTFLSL